MDDVGRVESVVLDDGAGKDGDEEQMAFEDAAWERAQDRWEAEEVDSQSDSQLDP